MGTIETRVAILASGDRESGGGGSTMEQVIRDTLEEKVGFSVGAVICNNPEGTVGVYPRVEQVNQEFALKGDDRIDVINIGPNTHPDGKQKRGQTLAESEAICRELERREVGFVSLLGYMRVLTGEFVDEWGWQVEYADEDLMYNGLYHPSARIINNHPGILPHTADTHGHDTHQKAYDLFRNNLIDRTAMTWHLVDPGVDSGPVVYAEPVDISPVDSVDEIEDLVREVELNQTATVIERHLKMREEMLRG